MADSRFLVDVFNDIVAAVRAEYDTVNVPTQEPYYIYGHPMEIAKRLALKDGSNTEKFQKFPLIVLITDFEEDHNTDDLRYDYTASPTVLIVKNTKPTYTSEERYTNTFKPTLYPLYILLLKKINESPYINTVDVESIDHVKTDRLFWGAGGTYGNTGLIFNDNLDAIEINFSDLTIIKDSSIACQ